MRIDRAPLLADLNRFVMAGSGVIVGGPGVGKSYLLGDLGEQLDTQGTPYLFLMIDSLGEVTEADLRREVGYEGTDLIASLAGTDLMEEIGILIIDGYDAARNERTQKNALELIRRARQELRGKWNVAVSVRNYDARKSPELLDLFGKGMADSRPTDPAIPCRHFVIPALDDQDLNQLRTASPELSKVLDAATGDFKSLLRTPFNLWLLEKLLPDLGDPEQLIPIRSEVQLLRLFWQRRVADGSRGIDREVILRSILKEMVGARSLSVNRTEVYDPALNEGWQDLLSREVLIETSSSAQRVRFRHNVLFDYAVSILLLDDQPDTLLRFLAEDRSRQLFLRPSLVYFFARLWHGDRDAFWSNYQGVLASEEASVRLLGQLLPPTVVVQEARELQDLRPLLDALKTDSPHGPEAILRFVRAMQAWNVRCSSLWLDFFAELVLDLRWVFAWDFGHILLGFFEEIKRVPFDASFNRVGTVARAMLLWIWAERNKTKASRWDAIAAQFGIPLVAQTYRTDPEASRQLLEPILAVTKEPDFSIQLIYRIAQYIEDIAPSDAAFTERLYLLVFSTAVSSEEKTLMAGGPVFSMTSTRRQDFQMCQYLLLEYFRIYLKLAPVPAARTALRCVDPFVEENHVRRHLNEGFSVADVTTEFAFRGGTAQYMRDSSFIWDRGSDPYEPTQMADDVRRAIGELAESPEASATLDLVLNLFRDEVRSAFLWRRLIGATTDHPDRFVNQAYELSIAEPLLVGPDTVHEMGQLFAVFSEKFSVVQRESVETFILALPKSCQEEYREGRTRVRNRLLAQIPSKKLVTAEAKAIRAELEATQSLPENRPLFSMSGGASTFTEDMWLAEQGVDLAVPVNKELRQASDDLIEALGSTRRDQATRERVEGAYPTAVRLENLLAADQVDDITLKGNSLTRLAQFANSAIVAIEGRTSEIIVLARRILLRCAKDKFPEAVPGMDQAYTSAVWADTPRGEAAQGLPFLLSRGADPEILEAVRILARDPVPSVRYLLTCELWRISESVPDDFWPLLQDITRRDENAVVLQGVAESLWQVTGRHQDKATAILDALMPRVLDGPDHSELARTFIALTIWLLIDQKHPWAVSLSARLLNEPGKYAKALSRATKSALQFVKPSKTGSIEENETLDTAVKWLLDAVQAAIIGLVAIRNLPSPAAKTEDSESAARTLYSVMDQLVLHLYFALDSKLNARQGAGKETTADARASLYWRVKPVLKTILLFARTPEIGVLAAPTAHYFMQILNGALALDPPGVIEMAWEVVVSARPHGFNLDSLAIEEVVKLIESVLADYRLEARSDSALGQIFEILEIFSETGWPQALRLVWRLDEVYR
jgi:hypothetical protein